MKEPGQAILEDPVYIIAVPCRAASPFSRSEPAQSYSPDGISSSVEFLREKRSRVERKPLEQRPFEGLAGRRRKQARARSRYGVKPG
jgi:hypothetical protein